MKLEARHLSTGYGNRVVSRDLNLTLEEGKLTCLLGRNGCGKSTLLRTLSGAQKPLSGTVTKTSPRELGIVLTDRIDVMGLRVRDVIAMGRQPYTGYFGGLTAEDEEIVYEAMNLTHTKKFADSPIASLSDGERQKIMIAKALAQQTPIILMDEPSAFLDDQSKVEMMQMLQYLAHEEWKSILLSTHDVEMAMQMSDFIWLLTQDGMKTGTPQEMEYEIKKTLTPTLKN